MNPNYQEFRFPQIRAHPLASIFKPSTPADSIDLIGKLLAYVPDKRYKSIEVRNMILLCFILEILCSVEMVNLHLQSFFGESFGTGAMASLFVN